SLPDQTSSQEEKELLTLLCKVHELEIQQVEMARNAIVREHDLYRRDLLLMRYDRQRALCEEIITKQRSIPLRRKQLLQSGARRTLRSLPVGVSIYK
ncbi:hypothetical protein Avbf_09959, partial [Armadillidium vulgare]